MTPSLVESTIAAALDKVATSVEPLGTGTWAVALMNGRPFEARVVLDEGWLGLSAVLGSMGGATKTARGAWDLLQHNAALGGGARLTLARVTDVRLRADIALDADLDLGDRIARACHGFEAAKTWFCGAGAEPDEGATDDVTSPAPGEELAEICRQTGWTVRARDGGAPAVDLEVPGAFYSATITSRGDGVTAAVALLDDDAASNEPSPTCRQALAILVLRTSGVVRMVCATASAGTPALPRFEVPFPGPPSAAELSHAFGALSVACRLAGREVSVLRHDETVADLYVRQWTENQQEKEE